MSKRVMYNGFFIAPAPYQAEFGKWSLKLTISRAPGGDGQQRLEVDENQLFEDQDQAYQGCLAVGRDIIDGRHPRYSVDGLS
jgi:hypothetical protein